MSNVLRALEAVSAEIAETEAHYKRARDRVEDAIRELRAATAGQIEKTVEVTVELTYKEKQVFKLLGDGLTPDEIAKRLDNSSRTIEAHRETLRKKYGFKKSRELVEFAIRNKGQTEE